MRENTRCEVEEPMSTPTLSTTISSSSTSERPVEEKKMRPPWASSVMLRIQRCRVGKGGGYACPSGKDYRAPCPRVLASSTSLHDGVGTAYDSTCRAVKPCQRLCPPYDSPILSRTHEFRHYGALLVEVILHPVLRAFRLELGGEFLAQIWILHVVRDRRSALRNIHGRIVGVLFAGRAGLAARIVRAEPGGEPEALLGRVEVLVKPARAARRRRHHAELGVVDALDLSSLAVLPRRHAAAFRPSVGVTVGFQADQHGRRSVRVRLGIAADLVLADPEIERVAGHERLDPAPADRAAVVERQVAIDDIRHEVGAPHGEAAHRI